MRFSAQWLLSEENLDEEAPGWVDIGFITSESTLLLLIAATVCAGVAARRAGRGAEPGSGRQPRRGGPARDLAAGLPGRHLGHDDQAVVAGRPL